ncbi:MAG: hypothetical protein ACRDYB_13855 [Acidimicrobiales bacterium]
MASTVDALFDAAGVVRLGAVPWRTGVPSEHPGVDVVARSSDPAAQVSGDAEIDRAAIRQLLGTRTELTLDGQRPSAEVLSDRLKSMWLPDEPVIYVGLAGTSLRQRVGQFYRTRLGARSPHAGGWPLKCISDLNATWVHFGECTDVKDAELKMLDAFMSTVAPEAGLACSILTFHSRLRTSNSRATRTAAGSSGTGSGAPRQLAEGIPHLGGDVRDRAMASASIHPRDGQHCSHRTPRWISSSMKDRPAL